MRGRKGTRRWRGEILTDTKKPCQFLSGAWDKINSPLFQTGRPYQFPADTGQIQIQPVNKSKSNTCNKSCWPPRTNPAAAASDKSKCVRWTNRICAPTQIRALRPGPCKGGAPPGLGWNIREHFAAWQRHFDTKDPIEIWGYFWESLRKFWLNAFFLAWQGVKKNNHLFFLLFLFRVQKETSSDSLVHIVGRFERWEKEQLLWFSHPLTGFCAECLQWRKGRVMKRWKDKLPPVSRHISFYSRGWMKERTCGYAEKIERERKMRVDSISRRSSSGVRNPPSVHWEALIGHRAEPSHGWPPHHTLEKSPQSPRFPIKCWWRRSGTFTEETVQIKIKAVWQTGMLHKTVSQT